MFHHELVAEKRAAIASTLHGTQTERLAQLRSQLTALHREHVLSGTPAATDSHLCSRGGLHAVAEHDALTDLIREHTEGA